MLLLSDMLQPCLMSFPLGTLQPGVLGWAPAGICSVPRIQPIGEQDVPAPATQPEPHQPAEGAGRLRPVEDRAEQQWRWRRWAKVSFCCPLFYSLSVCFTSFTVCADVVCLFTIPTQMSHGWKISGLSNVRKAERTRTQTTEHKELAMCPSPHIWCAGAGSGLGRRSDQPNEISQHTKCLSGPIRIPSCLPWVYLIDGKEKE